MTTLRVSEKAVPVLYLDMDGTVRKGKDELGRFVNGPEDVEVFPEATADDAPLEDRAAAGSSPSAIRAAKRSASSRHAKPSRRRCERPTGSSRSGLLDKITYCCAPP